MRRESPVGIDFEGGKRKYPLVEPPRAQECGKVGYRFRHPPFIGDDEEHGLILARCKSCLGQRTDRSHETGHREAAFSEGESLTEGLYARFFETAGQGETIEFRCHRDVLRCDQ